jgi:hypothetical protein
MNDDRLYQIAQALAPFLPGWSLDWDPVNRPRYALFTNAEGAGLYVELDRRKNPARLVVHGRYCLRAPGIRPFYPRPENRPRITVSSARPVEDIAADIQRRFIPRYLEAYAQVRKRLRLAEEIERQEAAILIELAAILDERVSSDKMIRYSNGRGSRYVYGYVQVSKDRVKIDLSGLPIATAREICRLLRDLK